MSLSDRLQEAGLLVPGGGQPDIGAVLSGSLASLGMADHVRVRDSRADQQALTIPDAQHVVIVLVDGMGNRLLEQYRGHTPFLRGTSGVVAHSPYPSTTAAALASFGTGCSVGATGMTGYTARDPDSGELLNLVSWDNEADPHAWQRRPSLMAKAAEAGCDTATVSKPRFRDSGLTTAALGGGVFMGAETLAERIDIAIRRVQSPGLTYVYTGDLDAAGHAHGPGSSEWLAELENVDRELSRLAQELPGGSVMVVTADHGMVTVTEGPQWDVAHNQDLRRDVELIAGEPRALHVHLTADADVGVAEHRWSHVLEGYAVVSSREEAIGAGFFGEVEDHVLARIGDLVVAMTGNATAVDSRVQSPSSMALPGMHGSLTPEEVEIPVRVIEGGA